MPHFIKANGERVSIDDVIGSSEAAVLLGRSSRHVHRLVASGKLAPLTTTPQGAYLFDPADVLRIAEAAA